ncbi:hypothetical protein [Paludibaculum fermentans]|uniref:hypothetical protein n=1 Tax=Paludibaculum fermentans TaxID=1473598 RepID=UPI003EBA6D95
MVVIETTLGTGPWPLTKPGPIERVLVRLLSATIPAANPDFDPLFENVRMWWVEIDPAGVPQRELGFDEQGQIIVAAPLGDNFGFFTDSNMTFSPNEHPTVLNASFESAWAEFESHWAERSRA